MKIDHLIIGAKDLADSVQFYMHVGFEKVGDFADSNSKKKGATLHFKKPEEDILEILILPFESARLPNPQHVAFETTQKSFNEILQKLKKMGIPIRAEASQSPQKEEIGTATTFKGIYKHFYVLDPAGVNIEFLTKI